MSEQKWVRSSLRSLSVRLRAAGHVASPPTVGRLLQGLDYALHVNAKRIEARGNHPDRTAPLDAYLATGSPYPFPPGDRSAPRTARRSH